MELKDIIGYVITSGIVGTLVTIWDKSRYAKQEKKLKNIEVESKTTDATENSFDLLAAQVKHQKESLADAYKTISEMQDVIDELRNKLITTSKQLADTELELIKANAKFRANAFEICHKEPCDDRDPPHTKPAE